MFLQCSLKFMTKSNLVPWVLIQFNFKGWQRPWWSIWFFSSLHFFWPGMKSGIHPTAIFLSQKKSREGESLAIECVTLQNTPLFLEYFAVCTLSLIQCPPFWILRWPWGLGWTKSDIFVFILLLITPELFKP